ncbi:LPS export ABC transporter periplasmic protein LptC [Solimicrobium silvestre]|uniref:Lipopolysaccharide-assembly, LptC-related n=1 Tax=Solimicrobium silvestre TaxID=2099400 RepID=A0A2S9H486_9BURK|nr:LPS export ABC transporter periplasmic protein LptC [Solimicrobium silvestre]PRC94794.1 Lipopolysaccharide-assembly, LptC-related [Solimicrobium silvestre]
MKISALFTPNNLRLWLLVMFVGLASLASYWVLEIIRSNDKNGAQAVRTRPDYYVDNFNFVKMLPNGQSKYRIVGTELIHYPDDDHADVTLPVMTNLDATQPPLTVRSERGVIKNIANQSENEVHLYEKVVVNRHKTDISAHLQLDTEYLLAYPDKNTMQTDLPVRILAGDTITTGVGLRANNATQQMQILSNVYSIVPPRTNQKRP